MSRVPYHGVAGQAETVGELAQVIAGRLPLLASTALLAGAGGTPSGGRAGRDDADGKPVALGEDPPVRRGDLSPVEQDAAGPLPLPGLRDGDFQLQAQVDLVERDADVPGANPGGAVSADDDAGGDGIAAREPGVRVAGLLADRADGGLLAHLRAGGQRPVQQRGVELIAHDHCQQRPGIRPGELIAAAQREGRLGDLVAGRQSRQVPHGIQRRPDQAAAAGLVPGMLGPLHDDRPRPRAGRRVRGRQPGRPAPDDRDVPLSPFVHQVRVPSLRDNGSQASGFLLLSRPWSRAAQASWAS
jgi:hypothetical protein